MMWLAFFISISYAFTILSLSMDGLLYKSFRRRHTDRQPSTTIQKKHSFSVIINFRNEVENLPGLLESITKIKYPHNLVEWFFINDASTDDSLQLIIDFQSNHPDIKIQVIDRIVKSASAKKDGITQAVSLCSTEHILCTDADVILPPEWIDSYNHLYHFHPEAHFIAGPVELFISDSLVSQLQHAEMVALQMVSIGAFSQRQPFMCSGANMSFIKSTFKEVDGYRGNDHISSGDDVFLLEKLSGEDVINCHFLKSQKAIVKTFPKPDITSMINQRARWAQKGTHTKSMLNKLVSIQVLLMNVAIIVYPILFLFGLVTYKMVLPVVIIKMFVDFLVLVIGHRFFDNKKWPYYFIPQFIIYPFITLSVTYRSFFKINWSNRRINQSIDG